MTLDPGAVPVADRALLVEGRVDRRTLDELGVSEDFAIVDGSTCVLWLSYAFADLQLGWSGEYWWLEADATVVAKSLATVDRVTQQFGEMFDGIPHGWKTIARFQFERQIPEVVRNLPELRQWSFVPLVRVGSAETWTAQRPRTHR